MTETQNHAFNTLLDAWNAHQDLRMNRAPFADLVASGQRLEAVRAEARRHLANN